MPYLFVVVIGAIVGWVAGQYVKGSEMGVMPDVAAGAAGAAAVVLLSRVLGLPSGFIASALISVIGGFATLYLMRQVLKEKPVPVRKRRRT